MKKKLSLITITVSLMCLLFSFTASADTGPKPSVIITFEGLSDDVCYATLLSYRDSSGPARCWNGKEAPDYYVSDRYYTVNAQNLEETDEMFTAEKSYDYKWEAVSLVARIIITILIETAIALIFSYRSKREFTVIFMVNVITQIVLNIILNIENYKEGYMAFTAYYIFLELIIFAIEAAVYSFTLKDKKRSKNILFALLSNSASFAAGLMLAHIIPGIF